MTDIATPEPPQPLGALARYGLALVLTGLTAGGAVLFERVSGAPNASLVFVLPVVIAAIAWGWGPSVLSAVAGALAFNFFLIEPRHTFAVEDPANLWALACLLGVGAIVSWIAAEARERAMEALRRAGESRALQALARTLVGAPDQAAIFAATAEALSRLFGGAAAVLIPGDGGGLAVAAATPRAALGEKDLEAARWALAARLSTRADAYPVDGGLYDFWPVVTPTRAEAVLGAALGPRGRRDADALIGIVSGYLVVALERERLARPVVAAKVRAAGEQIKADLLAAVSHDLKTPLSTILFTLQSLQRFAHDPAAATELLALAESETARLSGLVNNLLEMSRIEEGAVPVHPEAAPLHELVAGAVARAGPTLGAHAVSDGAKAAADLLMVDRALAEAALANVLENAAKYSPAGSTIAIEARRDGAYAALEVRDEGPGFPEMTEPLFEKFTRGVAGDGRPPGTGLGLAVARGFLEAQGGRITAENRTDRAGGLVRIWLPLATAPAT